MLSPLNVAILPVNVVVLGLHHEGSDRPCRGATHVTAVKQIMRTKILVTERHAAVQTLEARQYSQVMNSGRWRERLLLRKVRDEEQVVTAPGGQVYVEVLRSRVDAAPVTFSGNYDRRVVGDVLQFSQG